MQKPVVLIAMVLSFLPLAPLSQGNEPTVPDKVLLHQLDFKGWHKEYGLGAELLKELSSQDPEIRKKFDIKKYRDKKAAFAGGGPQSGGTNDLITDGGFYLRIVTKNRGADLRPKAAGWSVIAYGTIVGVYPENKIIVIEVEEWWVYMQA